MNAKMLWAAFISSGRGRTMRGCFSARRRSSARVAAQVLRWRRSNSASVAWIKTACAVFVLCAVAAISSPAQSFTTLVDFNGADGSGPFSTLVQGTDGKLYGTTSIGGSTACNPPYGCGTVFKMSPAGTLTMLYKFCSQTNCTDGSFPYAGLTLATDEDLYGTTATGGVYDKGTIFRITPHGALTTLYSFCAQTDCLDGTGPSALIQGADGNFYGTTGAGGSGTSCTGGCGTIFKMTSNGKLTTLHSFDVGDGYYPSSLIQGSDGNLYGTTYGTLSYTCQSTACGTVFKMTPEGMLTTLHTFTFTDGANPFGPLVESTKGGFSGTTFAGGRVLSECGFGCGTVFKITSAGKLTTLHDFAWGGDGANPYAGLVWATDGNFYGTTSNGGDNGVGTVFKIGSGEKLATLHEFGVDDGDNPSAGLVQDTDGTFYGTTFGDGVTSDGTVFSEHVGLGPFVTTLPTSRKVGQRVAILGTNLTGATGITFNGTSAAFTVISGTEIATIVPGGATTGTVQVVTPSGTLSSNVPFRVRP